MKYLILCFSIFASLSAFAQGGGDRVGNGGDVVVCPKRTVLLDAHEMKRFEWFLSLPGETVREKVMNVVLRVERLDINRGSSLRAYSSELLDDIEAYDQKKKPSNTKFTDEILSDVPDSLETSIPKGCRKEQLVTHREPVFKVDKRYEISIDYWKKLNKKQRAMTVLHEAWSRVFLYEGARDSRYARYMNGVFASLQHENMSAEDYDFHLSISELIGSFSGRRLILEIPRKPQ